MPSKQNGAQQPMIHTMIVHLSNHGIDMIDLWWSHLIHRIESLNLKNGATR